MGINASNQPTAGDYALAETYKGRDSAKKQQATIDRLILQISNCEKRLSILEKRYSLLASKQDKCQELS